MARKTLLVGLGGTGCSVVQQVKAMVGPNTQNIQFLGFDTDSNRAGTYGLDMVVTGRNILVDELLEHEPDANEWFPYEPTLASGNMQNGAGQVRALSRLALKDTIRQQGLGKLTDALNMLHTAGEGNQNVSFYITIVSSFAGGTGSGMFISLALYLRRFILNTFGTNCIIDGIFALPDLFMDEGVDEVQRESMFANTFAALKELVNVNRVCLSRNPSANDIKMVYRAAGRTVFDSTEDRASETELPVKFKPFDLMFFFDKVSADRTMLVGGVEEYIHSMAQAVFMRCFAPAIMDTVRSREDNQKISHIEANNENLFGSLGTARMIYPYQDILRYCDLRSAEDTIGDCWYAPEIDYKRRHEEELARNKVNPNAPVRSKGEIYIAWMDTNIERPMFTFLRNAITQVAEQKDGQDVEPDESERVNREDAYFEAVGRFLQAEAESEASVPENIKFGPLESVNRGRIVGKVRKTEKAIKASFNRIKDYFTTAASYRVDDIFPQTIGQMLPEFGPVEAYNIVSLLREDGHAVHPLAARYLLYKVYQLFKTAGKDAKDKAESAEKEIDKYIHQDWIPKTTNVKETAEKAIPSAINVLGLQDFSHRYVSASRAAIDQLNTYRINQFTSHVFEGVTQRLDVLIAQYEQLFDQLPNIMKDMDEEITKLSTKHVSIGLEQYVCADSVDKERIYDSLDKPMENSPANPIYDSLLYSLCDYSLKILENKQKALSRRQAISQEEEQYEQNRQVNAIKRLFNNKILPHYFKLLNDQKGNAAKLDKDIVTALNEEATKKAIRTLRATEGADHDEPTEEDRNQARLEIIADLISRAAPQLRYNTGKNPITDSKYWGVNRGVDKNWKMKEILRDGSGKTPSVEADVAFPRHELMLYRSVLGLLVSNVKMFVDFGKNQGEYYQCYMERLRKISAGFYNDNPNKELSITPHADARWHLREYLQPLSEERDLEDKQKAARAMWLGILYECIFEGKNLRTNQLCVRFAPPKSQNSKAANTVIPLFFRSNPVKNFNQMYELYHALLEDNLIKQRLLDVLDPIYKDDAHRFKAVGGSGYNMKGTNANPLLKALHDEKNAAKPQAGHNVLTLAEDILKLQAVDQRDIALLTNEKNLIIQELMKIINGLQISPARKKELCSYIAKCSIYRTNAASRSRDAQFLPDFNLLQLVDDTAKPARQPRKKAAEPAAEPVTATPEAPAAPEEPVPEKTVAKKPAARKTSAKKASAPEEAPAEEKKKPTRKTTKKTQE